MMRAIRMGLWYVVYGIGFSLIVLAVLLAVVARFVHPGEPEAARGARRRAGVDGLVALLQRTAGDNQSVFVSAEMKDGPGDGRPFPLDTTNPPPRIPYTTGKALHWYAPRQQANGTWIWEHQPADTVVK